MVTEIQLELFNKIKSEICNKVQYSIAGKNAIEVVTPFLDWKGIQVSFFITESGHVTDGGQILSQLKSLRIIEDFNNWEFKLDFFNRSHIQQIRGKLEPTNDESPSDILKYVQGITRLPNYFEPKPMYSSPDKFPTKVRNDVKIALMSFAPYDDKDRNRIWTEDIVKERRIPLNGIEVQSDMSPREYYRMVQIISHATSSSSDKNQHVSSKILPPVLWRRKESKVEFFAVLEDFNIYPTESRILLKQEVNEIVEMKYENSIDRLAKILVEEMN